MLPGPAEREAAVPIEDAAFTGTAQLIVNGWGSIGKPAQAARMVHVAACGTSPQRALVVAVDDEDRVWRNTWVYDHWVGWDLIDGMRTSSRPSLARGWSETHLAVRGTDGMIHEKLITHLGTWQSDSGLRGFPALNRGRLSDKFAIGYHVIRDGQYLERVRFEGGQWRDAEPWQIPGQPTPLGRLPSASPNAPIWRKQAYDWVGDQVPPLLAAQDLSYNTWVSAWNAEAQRWDWADLGRPPVAGTPWDPFLSRTYRTDHATKHDICIVWGGDWRVWARTRLAWTTWSAWEPLGTQMVYSSPVAASASPGGHGVFAVGPDGTVWTTLVRI